MANKLKGEVKIKIDGEDKTLSLTNNVLISVEDILDRPIHRVTSRENIGLREIRAFLYAGIKWEAGTTIEDVGEKMEFSKIKYYAEKLGKAMKYAIPEADREKIKKEAEGKN